MIFLNEKNRSILQKMLIIIFLSSALFFAMFTKEFDLRFRQIILFICMFIYILRLGFTLFLFLQRRLVWSETLTICMIMSIVLFILAFSGKTNPKPFIRIDLLGIFLYIIGSFINTHSEYLRYIWKKNPENKGHIYQYGWFRYAMHINYLGDVLLFSGLSILTGRYWTLIIPTGMLLNFILFIIPSLDNYLLQKYGDEFIKYSNTTKKLIPYVY